MRSALAAMILVAATLFGARDASAATTCQFTTSQMTMRLVADCTTDASILIPDGYTLDGRGHTITAVDPAGDHFRGGILQNAPGATTVNIRRVTITTSGLSETVCDTGDDKLRGIALLGAGGSVRDTSIMDIGQGAHLCPEGSGIIANSPPFDGTNPATKVLVIDNVTVRNFQYVGLQASGDIRARITESDVAGALEPGIPTAGQVGVFAGPGAQVAVQENKIRLDPTSTNVFVTGILLDDADRSTVDENWVDGPYEGIFVDSYCRAPALSGDRNRITENRIFARNEGVVLVARSLSGTSTCNAHVNNNLVEENKISAVSGGPAPNGIFVGTQVLSGAFVPVAAGNVIEDNRIAGFTTGIVRSGDTGTIVKHNVITP